MTEAAKTFRWLPPGLRPPEALDKRQERIFLLVGAAALFAGYDMNVFGLAIPQIQQSLAIPENEVGLTVAYFRLAAIAALLVAAFADLVGRRTLLVVTIFGQALFTLLTAFAGDYAQFVWAQVFTRVFGYAEEMLCLVVIAEEVSKRTRGWAAGTISAFNYIGAGLAAIVFIAIEILPYGWRSMYVIGALPLFVVAFMRRNLPETQRFEALDVSAQRRRPMEIIRLIVEVARAYPRRLAAILTAATAFGFAISPASVMSSKYLQDVHGYSPGEVSAVLIPGGLVGLALAILAGRMSDRFGRRPMTSIIVIIATIGFALFYSGMSGPLLPLLWILAFFGYFAGEALIAGFALEILPTQYRATVSGLRYLCFIGAGAVALALEGVLYDMLGGHGQAISAMLLAAPVVLVMLWLLPEPAGKSLEEMTAR